MGMDNSSMGAGFVAVFAASGSVALLAHQINKRLLSEFMKKFEIELVGSNKHHRKKKVRFADDVAEPPSGNKVYRKKHSMVAHNIEKMSDEKEFETMPLNWRVLYKGIIESKALKERA